MMVLAVALAVVLTVALYSAVVLVTGEYDARRSARITDARTASVFVPPVV